ncbi:hypothetical protein LOTGIDRAFT_228903 [Lottia gigantea]|uniref:Uncharacterized protein n=1 Tax=Lottia gigantea TaxID=225164 RepID=V3ZCX1_LOTGI|nr:hypothetical protein LOTGIDRAFT_228903 [Lottia gigantea]ESO88933.1 hypothetical protein LOTGIDRAFT_228903 [Lottia gigantea]
MLDQVFTSYTSLILVGITLILWLVWTYRKPEGLPPGPTPLPIIGNVFSMLKRDTREAFSDLQKQYGDIFTLIIGNGTLIVVNGLDAIKDMLVKNGDTFSDRPTNLVYSDLTMGLGIINTSGNKWKEQRRFALSTLRDFGMGRIGMEERISKECQVCMDKISKYEGKPFDPTRLLMCCVSNVICATMFGKRYQHDDEDFVFHLESVHDSAQKLGNASFFHFFPIFGHFLLRDIKKRDKRVRYGICLKEVQDHQNTDSKHGDISDFIDAYLKETKDREGSGESSSFNEQNLLQILGEFFFAGTETLTTTFRWALIYLSLYPEHQRAAQEELDRVVGRNRKPCMNDKKSLPVVEATILEIQRLGDVVPFSVPHAVAKETVYKGYRIPAKAIILPNISSILNSKELWGDPEVFRPSRFLDKDSKSLTKEANIPFSLGKRLCLGESLARMELFIFLSTFLQNFTFSLPESQPKPCLKGVIGITRMPHAYNIIATKR